MSSGWPPDGYSSPKGYENHDRRILVTGLILTIPAIVVTEGPIGKGGETVAKMSIAGLQSSGINDGAYLTALAIGGAFGWILISGVVIVLIHEAIHFAVGELRNAKPQFKWSSTLNIPNPSVVAYRTGLNRWDHILMLSAPFTTLSTVCGIVMWFSSGVIAGTAAVMFAVNAVPSCADIYDTFRISTMPKGTLFANFDDEGTLRSEFVIPDRQE